MAGQDFCYPNLTNQDGFMSENNELIEQVRAALGKIPDPETGRGLKKQILSVESSDGAVNVSVGLTSFAAAIKDEFKAEVESTLAEQFSDSEFKVQIENFDRPPQPIGTVGLKCKAVIAIAAGKGGVGKSTAATSLAIALKRAGSSVGLLDADVYGPSIPQLTGIRGRCAAGQGEKIAPMDFDGIPLMSIGYMIPPGEAVIWRGPMLHSAITTFVRNTDWGDLDYLIIDMPPGTGDIALSLSQLLPLTGSVIVCTPQEVALIDAVKAVGMFRKVKIPVIGLIENMSSFICPDNGKSYDIFGKGGAKEYADQDNIPYLGEIPININLRQRGDSGKMFDNFDDETIGPYLETIAKQLVTTLAKNAAANPPTPTLPVIG
jgi:ATP-binding protein involved in chromosome partitioning